MDIQKNVKLSDYSTFKIGGPAKEFVIVKNEEDLTEAINYAKKNSLKFFILGGGSNVLFNDKGFDGLVIKLQAADYKPQGTLIECDAGLLLSQLVNLAAENNLSGLEWAGGIPGTVGGAIRGNAGAFGSDMSKSIESVRVFNDEELNFSNYDANDCQFEYRNSLFKKNPKFIILSAKIKFEKGDKEEIENKTLEIIERRKEKQPQSWIGSAGSFFENPKVDNPELIKKFEEDKKTKSHEGRIPSGWLIEEAGLKGKKVGGAMVSEKNANFIINNGRGTSEEIMMLASVIKQKVREEFGVQLKEEVKYVAY